jgi:uncharacterized membrane protein
MTTNRRNSLKDRALLVATVLAVLSAGNAAADDAAKADEKIACYGINKCKGTGDCSGQGHQCSGQNACRGRGHINLPKDVCLRIEGGHLVPGPDERG